ncbi:hypothetical protein Btru_049682 [Bulinus truncatus]|nr:hypothetical protein Btru_049682 [Bulinus truncatus]
MFLSDPVTLWFRRKSVDSVVSPTKVHPSISISEDGDENESIVLSSSPSTSACSSRSTSPCPSPSKQKRSRSWRKKGSAFGRGLGRSVSSCADSATAARRDQHQSVSPPLIYINGDSPHRLERSLSNTADLRSSREFYSKLSCASPDREPQQQLQLQVNSLDLESIPAKLLELQNEWGDGRGYQHRGWLGESCEETKSRRSRSRSTKKSFVSRSISTTSNEDDSLPLCQSPTCSGYEEATRASLAENSVAKLAMGDTQWSLVTGEAALTRLSGPWQRICGDGRRE